MKSHSTPPISISSLIRYTSIYDTIKGILDYPIGKYRIITGKQQACMLRVRPTPGDAHSRGKGVGTGDIYTLLRPRRGNNHLREGRKAIPVLTTPIYEAEGVRRQGYREEEDQAIQSATEERGIHLYDSRYCEPVPVVGED